MKIELAESYGFCFGVKRAIKIAEDNQNSSTFGALIHNSKEISRLKNDFNVTLSEDLSDFKKGDKAVVRTHGIVKEDLASLYRQEVDVIDATCPYVTKLQKISESMSEEGYDVVIFGDEEHPEIRGVKSYVGDRAFVVLKVEELERIALQDKIAIVAQTTRKVEEYQKLTSYLIENYKEVRVFNTICNATFENQNAVRNLASRADVMIIIGGKNSSNTKQLHSIAENLCEKSYHIEDTEEIKKEWFKNATLCGIGAGASTPDWVIQEVIEVIEKQK
ncbi:MAG: 4-hydroxy-3-methylbut-2-enyl diphosphate reductase [Helicobacteraceae bacterium]|nr:4-hydroxy-3-methylbut-2-enyl diphosphate reductase [Helicobacteraceae bacterium]